jgi:hypothetical protein
MSIVRERSSVKNFTRRLAGALALNRSTYEDVEADPTATGQAVAVVLLASLATAVGAPAEAGVGPRGLLVIALAALGSWAAWALVTLEIGRHLLPEPTTRVRMGEMLRTMGFSAAPGLLRVLGVVPGLAAPVFALTALWMLAAMIVAVRQALDFTSTARAIAVCGLGFVLTVAIMLILGLWFGPSVS